MTKRAGRYQMQSLDPGGWKPMEQGSGGSHWRPRSTLTEAAVKCWEWTGGIGIPAMQVVDLDTGEVLWRDSREYESGGEPIGPFPPHEIEEPAKAGDQEQLF